MTDVEPLAPDAGLPPVLLLANSYSLSDLMKASDHLVELKTTRGREENAANIPEKLALNKDVLAGLNQPALPPEHILRNVEDSSGNVVRAAMPLISDFSDPEPSLDPNAGISAGGAEDEDLPALDVVNPAPPPEDPEPDPEEDPQPEEPVAKPRRKRSTTAPTD